MCTHSTNRLHFIDLSLVFDDGAVEFFLLRPQLQLQLPVLLLLPPHVSVVATATASTTNLLPVHNLRQLVDGLWTNTGATAQALACFLSRQVAGNTSDEKGFEISV